MYDNDYTDYGYDIFNEYGENPVQRLAKTVQQQNHNYRNKLDRSAILKRRIQAIDNAPKTKSDGDVKPLQNSQGRSSALKRGILALTLGSAITAAHLLRNRKNHNAPKFKEEDFEALKERNKLYSLHSGLNNINRNEVPQSDEQSQHQQDSGSNINPPSNDSDNGAWTATKWGLGTVAAAAIGYGGYKLIKHLVSKYKDKIINSKDSPQAKRAALNSIINDINVKISKATTEEEKDELIKARKELQKTLGEIK